jgi:chemotaxis protein MotB
MARYLKKPDEKSGSADWMTTYSDMMTILFVLFVLLFSMSSINPVKWDLLVQTWGNQDRNVSSVAGEEVPGQGADSEMIANWLDMMDLLARLDDITDSPQEEESTDSENREDQLNNEEQVVITFDHVYNVISSYVEIRGYSDRIDIEKDDNFILIRFKDRVFFRSGMARIDGNAIEIIKFIGEAIGLVLDQVDVIRIEGHTDSIPQEGWEFPDNWALSQERARQVLLFLIDSGLPTDRRLLQPIGYADTHPIDTNETPEGRSANRRVEIIITRADVIDEEVDLEERYDIDSIAGTDE